MDKKIVQLMVDSNYSLEQFSDNEINKVEKNISHKANNVFGNSKIQKMAMQNTKVQSLFKLNGYFIRACCFL